MVDSRGTLRVGAVMFDVVSGALLYQGVTFIQPILLRNTELEFNNEYNKCYTVLVEYPGRRDRY